MRKYLIPIIVIIIIIILVIVFYKPASKETIKIGAILPLSGSNSVYGELSKKGIDIAIEEINANEGANSEVLKVIYEDSQSKSESAIAAFNKLTSIDNVKIVLTEVSSVALVISPLANENKIIQMDVGSTTPKYVSKGDYTFRTSINAYFFAEAMSRKLLDKDIKKLAILYINNDWGIGYKDKFKESFTKEGEILIEESFLPDSLDFRTQITKIKDKNSPVILLISHTKETSRLLNQIKELGLNVSIYSDVYSVENQEIIDIAGEAAEGIIYIAPEFNTERKDNIFQDYKKTYQEKFNEIPESLSAQAYDAIKILAKAIKQCNYSDNTTCLRDELYKIKNFNGVSGNITFSEYGEIKDKPIMFKMIRNGEFIPHEE